MRFIRKKDPLKAESNGIKYNFGTSTVRAGNPRTAMAERALQQGTAPTGVGVTKWRWLVLEAERAAGCSCTALRTQRLDAAAPCAVAAAGRI